jgi:hypothetical protein
MTGARSSTARLAGGEGSFLLRGRRRLGEMQGPDDRRRRDLVHRFQVVDVAGGERAERHAHRDHLAPPPDRHRRGRSAPHRIGPGQVPGAQLRVLGDDHRAAAAERPPGGPFVQRERVPQPAERAVFGGFGVSPGRCVDQRDAAGRRPHQMKAVPQQLPQHSLQPRVAVDVGDRLSEPEPLRRSHSPKICFARVSRQGLRPFLRALPPAVSATPIPWRRVGRGLQAGPGEEQQHVAFLGSQAGQRAGRQSW